MLKNAIGLPLPRRRSSKKTLELTQKEVAFLKTLFDQHADEVSDLVDDYGTFFNLAEKIEKL
jgi:hypothetical protein